MRVLWSRANAPAAITNPEPGMPQLPGESGAQYFARVVAHVRAAVPDFQTAIPTQIAEDDVPEDRTFRDAWKVQAGAVVVDMPKAREIQKTRVPDVSKHAQIDAARTPGELITAAQVRGG